MRKFSLGVVTLQLVLQFFSGSSRQFAEAAAAMPQTGSGERIIAVGHTDSTNFPVRNAFRSTAPGGGQDGTLSSVGLAAGSASQFDFSTYFGGSGVEQVRDVFVNPQGEIYIAGRTTSTDMGTTGGVVFPTYRGGASDAFIAKFIAAGQLLFATFLGGAGDDTIYSITVDAGGFIYVSGRTSGGFPTTAGAFQSGYGGGPFDFFVAKLNASASSVVWATYVGGSADDSARGRIAVDASGNVLVAGETQSNDFPGQIGALRGDRDGALVKVSANGAQLLFSRLIGGNEPTAGNLPDSAAGGLALAPNGDAYVCGLTRAPDIPASGRGYSGEVDGYVARVSSTGQVLAFTYLGGSGNDQCDGLALDPSGNPVILSTTASFNFPVTAGAYQLSLSGEADAAITKLSADLSTLIFSTYLGGNGAESGDTLRVRVGSSGNIVAIANTDSRNFPVTPDAVQPGYGGGITDMVIVKMSADGRQLLYASYLGGSGDEVARSVAYLESSSSAPSISSVSPAALNPGSVATVTLGGTNFVANGTSLAITSGSGVTISNVAVQSATLLTATFTVAANAPLGGKFFEATTAAGTSNTAVIDVLNPTTLSSISPTSGSAGASVVVTLTGTNFYNNSTVVVSGGSVTVSNVVKLSNTQLRCTFTIASGAFSGPRGVTVKNIAGSSNALSFTVNGTTAPRPTLTSLTPSSGTIGSQVTVTLNGTNFDSSAAVTVSGSGVTASNVTLVSATRLTANFQIAGTAATGPRSVSVTTSTGASNALSFTVTMPPPPTITGRSPAVLNPGQIATVSVTGTDFVSGATSLTITSGSGVSISNVVVQSSTLVTATFTVAANAPPGGKFFDAVTPAGASNTAVIDVLRRTMLSSISPATGRRGTSLLVTLTGTDIYNNSSVLISGTGVSVSNVSRVSSTQLRCTFTIASNAPLGGRSVIIRNLAGDSNAVTFTVQ